MGINIGAFFSPIAAAYFRNNFGWWYAFAAAGAGDAPVDSNIPAL
jgi:POT family proton-dependent oligopeptide transporter